jgi:hypothetical protein
MLKRFLGSAVALSLLFSGSALADELGNGAAAVPEKPFSVQPMPVVCVTESYFQEEREPSISLWAGVTKEENAEFVLYERVDTHDWYLVMHTDNGLACILNGGEQHQFLGDEADAS